MFVFFKQTPRAWQDLSESRQFMFLLLIFFFFKQKSQLLLHLAFFPEMKG